MVLVSDNHVFLDQLGLLFTKCKDKRSVAITMKRFQCEVKKQGKQATTEFRCLVRATDGKKSHKTKISTVVAHKDHVRFQMQFATVLKLHTDALKKKERKRKAKAKSTD